MWVNDSHLSIFQKKRLLGTQNGSKNSRLEKLTKIVNCDTIKEIERNNGGSQAEYVGDNQYPPRYKLKLF